MTTHESASVRCPWWPWAALLFVASVVRAEAPRLLVALDESACAAPAREEVLTALRVELPEQLLERADDDAATHRVQLSCEGDHVTVIVRDRKARVHTFATDLAQAPSNVRARVLALAVAEFMRELALASAEAKTAVAPPRPAPPPPVVPAPARSPAPAHWELAGFAQLGSLRFDEPLFYGGGLELARARGHLSVSLEASVATTEQVVSTGSARALLVQLAPTLAYLHEHGRFRTRVGAGYALGLVNVEARARRAGYRTRGLRGVLGVPELLASVTAALDERLALVLSVHAGWVVVPVIAELEGGRDLRVTGLVTRLALGLSVRLP